MSNNLISKIRHSLYWKISAVFLAVLALLGILFLYISLYSACEYNEEISQKLNVSLAEHAVKEVKPFTETGEINEEGLHHLMHSMMTINPSVEVYLLGPQGEILNYVAPYKEIKLKKVNLEPVQQFLKDPENLFIKGDDPKTLGESKVFSAAPIMEGDELLGYFYIILASQEYDSATNRLLGSYILRVGMRTMGMMLLGAMILGLLVIWGLTKNLNKLTGTIRRFQDGDLNARVSYTSRGELGYLGNSFNQMADTLEQNIDELKSVERLRRELIANVSHDLRTPIASIYGYLETMELRKENLSDEERDQYLDIIIKNTKYLNKLVNELFELSKLEAREQKPNFEAMSLPELASDVIQKYRILANQKGISINTLFSNNTPMVMGDVALMDRVLQNLIDNAIKYCKSGDSINIDIHHIEDKVKVIISDSGIGIDKERIPYIFERFQVAGRDHSSNSTGLGLAIVKKILDLHKSVIKVESLYGKGSTFTFSLPTT